MASLNNFKHITDLIHFESVDAKIREEIKKYYLTPDIGGRANYLHLFEYNSDNIGQKTFSFCNEHQEWEEETSQDKLYSATEFKIHIIGNPHYTYCKKCVRNFNKRK